MSQPLTERKLRTLTDYSLEYLADNLAGCLGEVRAELRRRQEERNLPELLDAPLWQSTGTILRLPRPWHVRP